MKKIKFGTPTKTVKEALDRVVKTHSPLLEKLADIGPVPHMQDEGVVDPVKETVIVETRTVEVQKVVTKDKLARRHSKLSRKRMDAALDQMCDILKEQNVTIADLRSKVKKLAEISDAQAFDINALRMQKSQEKQILTERTVVEKHIPKKLVYALIGSLILNGLVILLK